MAKGPSGDMIHYSLAHLRGRVGSCRFLCAERQLFCQFTIKRSTPFEHRQLAVTRFMAERASGGVNASIHTFG